MKTPTINQILPELNEICDKHGIEKKLFAPRNVQAHEYGYLKAYAIWLERRGLLLTQRVGSFTIVLAIVAKDRTKKFS